MLVMNKNGKMSVSKPFLITVSIVVVGCIAAIASKDFVKKKNGSNDRYIQGWIDSSWATFTVPKDTNFTIEPHMFLVKEKKEKDTVLRIANAAYKGLLGRDSNVISVQPITHVTEVSQ